MSSFLSSRAGALVGATMVFCVLSGPASATTPIAGSVDAAADVTIGVDNRVEDVKNQTASWSGAPQDLAASVHVNVSRNGDVVDAVSSDTAKWVSADQGSLSFNDSWSLSLEDPSNLNETAGFNPHPYPLKDWTYTFTADQAGFITFDYNVYSEGDMLGIGGIGLRWRRVGAVPQFAFLTSNILIDKNGSDTESGSYSVALVAGATYSFFLEKESNIGMGGGVGSRSALTRGEIDWHITGVPEPTTWAFMILGFGLVGAAQRRARNLEASAA